MEASNQEFLRALHEEKIRTQTERADYMTRKLAFITVLSWTQLDELGNSNRRFLLAVILRPP